MVYIISITLKTIQFNSILSNPIQFNYYILQKENGCFSIGSFVYLFNYLYNYTKYKIENNVLKILKRMHRETKMYIKRVKLTKYLQKDFSV